eukprot:NODE_1745_length_550_cov_703.712575_g1410_i0.p1 GENE.NODE_1745_length_550_cov_703.712575_g1410_i0~~NODE_1745_length_550_cov_703.712575_g1410_i0.p1  ORF type:complete len:165 (+),score=27.72 NODE_1745_length_550_cov_703.712575_g1410_i0:26-496(+)
MGKRILGIVPFLGLLNTMLRGETVDRIRCHSGCAAFNVTTWGTVTACPIAPELDSLGDIRKDDFDHSTLRDSVLVGGQCDTCDIRQHCGGRCLYANKTMWWGEDGFQDVCNTVRHLVSEVQTRLVPACQAAIAEGWCTLQDDFSYPPWDNTTEIIP